LVRHTVLFRIILIIRRAFLNWLNYRVTTPYSARFQGRLRLLKAKALYTLRRSQFKGVENKSQFSSLYYLVNNSDLGVLTVTDYN